MGSLPCRSASSSLEPRRTEPVASAVPLDSTLEDECVDIGRVKGDELPTRWKVIRRSATRRRTNLGVTKRRSAVSLMVRSGLGATSCSLRRGCGPYLEKAVPRVETRRRCLQRHTALPVSTSWEAPSTASWHCIAPSDEGDQDPEMTRVVDRPPSCITMRRRLPVSSFHAQVRV